MQHRNGAAQKRKEVRYFPCTQCFKKARQLISGVVLVSRPQKQMASTKAITSGRKTGYLYKKSTYMQASCMIFNQLVHSPLYTHLPNNIIVSARHRTRWKWRRMEEEILCPGGLHLAVLQEGAGRETQGNHRPHGR